MDVKMADRSGENTRILCAHCRIVNDPDGRGEQRGRGDGEDDRGAVAGDRVAVTGQEGKEGELFWAVLKHSLGLLLLVGFIVLMYAYVFPAALPNEHQYW